MTGYDGQLRWIKREHYPGVWDRFLQVYIARKNKWVDVPTVKE